MKALTLVAALAISFLVGSAALAQGRGGAMMGGGGGGMTGGMQGGCRGGGMGMGGQMGMMQGSPLAQAATGTVSPIAMQQAMAQQAMMQQAYMQQVAAQKAYEKQKKKDQRRANLEQRKATELAKKAAKPNSSLAGLSK